MSLFNKNVLKILALTLAVTTAFFACGCNSGEDAPGSKSEKISVSSKWEDSSSSEAEAHDETIVLSDFDGDVVVHTEAQSEFLAMENLYNVKQLANGDKELSRPLPTVFGWEDLSLIAPVYYILRISENADLTGGISEIVFDKTAEIYNLKIASKYYWTVTAVSSDGSKRPSARGEFTTEDAAPRNVYVSGVTNWRDLGGWKTDDGKRVKQGLIYRTGRLNRSNKDSLEPEITQKGLTEANARLKIKSEIDLRGYDESSKISVSALGEDVNYYRVSMRYEGDVISYNSPQVKEVFDILGDQTNYPVIFHCHIGTDRTGFVAYLINGLLGVGKQALYKDYLFSNFGNIDGPRSLDDIASRYVATLNNYEGATLKDKIRNYLLSIGVTETTINNVIKILK